MVITNQIWTIDLFFKKGQLGLGMNTLLQLLPSQVKFSSETKIVNIACGWNHSIAISDTGVVFSFGWGSYSQLGHGNTDDYYSPTPIEQLENQKIVASSCGGWHSVFLSGLVTAKTFLIIEVS